MAKIQIYGGKARTGSILLQPFSDDAVKRTTEVAGFLTEFPEIKYSTDWGSWEDSNNAFVGSIVSALGGGKPASGRGIAGVILGNAPTLIQALAGSGYVPPILTDKWTQLAAQLNKDGSVISLQIKMLAYPVNRGSGVHVEGLRGDPENLDQALNLRYMKSTNMWDWIKLGKEAMMPVAFTTQQISNNLGAIVDNLNGEKGTSGKMIIEGAGKIKDTIFGDGNFKERAKRGVSGLGDIMTGLVSANQRSGFSYTVQIFDADGNSMFNSKRPSDPLDFYITGMNLDFSPHIVRLIDSRGNKMGVSPEWCKIELTLTSSCRASLEQISKMCEYKYEV